MQHGAAGAVGVADGVDGDGGFRRGDALTRYGGGRGLSGRRLSGGLRFSGQRLSVGLPPSGLRLSSGLQPSGLRPSSGLRLSGLRLRLFREVGHADQAGESGRRRLGVVEEDERGVDGPEEAVEVEGGGRGRTDGHRAVADQPESGDQDGGQADVLGDVQPSVEAEHQVDAAHGEVDGLARAVRAALGVPLLQPVAAYGDGPADRLQELLLLSPVGDALVGVERDGAAYVPAGGEQLDGDGEQRGEEEPYVQQGQGAEGEADREDGAGHLGQGGADGLGDPSDVAGDAGGEVSGAGAFQAVGGEVQGAFDELLAQPGQDGLAEAGDAGQPEGRGDALDGGDRDEQHDRKGQVSGGAAVGDDVDDPAQQRLDEETNDGGRDQHADAGEGEAPVGPHQGAQGCAGAGSGGDGEELGALVGGVRGRGHVSTAVR